MWSDSGYGQWFWSEDDLSRLQGDGRKLLDSELASEVLCEQEASVAGYWENSEKILKAVEGSIGRGELAEIFMQYTNSLRRIYAHFNTSVAYVTYAVESELLKLIEEKRPRKVEEYFQIITAPTKPNILSQELADWLKIAKNPRRDRIISHTKKYPIMLANIFSEDDALKWARNRLKNKSAPEVEDEIRESGLRRESLKERRSEILESLSSDRVNDLSRFLGDCSVNRLLIKACWNGESYYLLPFFEKVSSLGKCSVKDVYMFYTWEDIHRMLSEKTYLKKNELERRRQAYLLYFNKPKIEVFSGDEAHKMKKRLLSQHIPSRKIRVFSGSVANKGVVFGRVKILKDENPNKIKKFIESLGPKDILVTGMTNPTMVAFMDNIQGIITDEGGVACHAAIISREYGIPCIVGCKMATLVLRNNDQVLLDAERGVVERIS